MAQGVEVRRPVDVQEEARHPARGQLDDADAQVGEALEHPVQDEVGQGNGRCEVQEDGVEELLALLALTLAPRGVERALELGDVKHRSDTRAAERGPHGIEIRVRERLPVHGCGCDHGQPNALRPYPLDLLHRPRRVVQHHVCDAVETALPLGAHAGREAVVRTCVRPLRLAIRGQPLLPQEAVVGEHDRGVEPETVERGETRVGEAIGVRHQFVERRRRVLATQAAEPVVPDQARAFRDGHLQRSEPAAPPGQPGPARIVVRDGERVGAVSRVDEIRPGRPGLEEMLVDVDGLQRHGPSRPHSTSGSRP